MRKQFNFFIYLPLLLCFFILSSGSLSAYDKTLHQTHHLTNEELHEAVATIGNPESILYNEEKYCEVLRKAIDSPLVDEGEKIRAGYRLSIAAKNRPGSPASDFSFETRDGKVKTLYHLNDNLPVLLLFYDPDCYHCLQTIDALKESDITSVADVVAIYAEEDREIWEDSNLLLPENWTEGFALDPIQEDETYVFLTSPVIYLLTPDKTVLLKDTTLSAVADRLGITIKNTLSESE